MPPIDSRPVPGLVLGQRYELRVRLAASRLGSVWDGHDLLLRRDVAVKVSDRSPAAAQELAHEARLTASVAHRSLPRVHDLDHHDGRAWMVAERLTGPSLDDLVRTGGPLDADRAGVVAGQLVGALTALHEAGLVHRGVHAANILLEPDRAVLVGLGSAGSNGSRYADYDGLHRALSWATGEDLLQAA